MRPPQAQGSSAVVPPNAGCLRTGQRELERFDGLPTDVAGGEDIRLAELSRVGNRIPAIPNRVIPAPRDHSHGPAGARALDG